MTGHVETSAPPAGNIRQFVRFLQDECKPRGKLLTPFNIISVPIILVGAVLIAIRFVFGLGAVTNLSQDTPWGVWIGFDVVTGVAFAGGAYVVTFMVYILGREKYHSIVRATVLNGFLAYIFYAGALMLDLGRPWKIINPIIGNSFGVSSVLFLVAWHFMLYMTAEFIEFSPAVAEWLGWRRIRKIAGRDARRGDLRHHALHAAPVGSRGALPDGQDQDPSALVLGVHPGALLRVEHLRRPVHGDLRGFDQPQGLRFPDRPRTPRRVRRHPARTGQDLRRHDVRLLLPSDASPSSTAGIGLCCSPDGGCGTSWRSWASCSCPATSSFARSYGATWAWCGWPPS